MISQPLTSTSRLCQATFKALIPKPVALHEVSATQLQDPVFGLVECHTVSLSPPSQPVQVPLQSLPCLQKISTPAQLGIVSELNEGALDTLVGVTDKVVK